MRKAGNDALRSEDPGKAEKAGEGLERGIFLLFS